MSELQLPPQEPPPSFDSKKVDSLTVVFLVYILYKLNMFTRVQVKAFMDLVKADKFPADITEYLLNEVKKI